MKQLICWAIGHEWRELLEIPYKITYEVQKTVYHRSYQILKYNEETILQKVCKRCGKIWDLDKPSHMPSSPTPPPPPPPPEM
ncbi:hypothetical protein LCGC14_1224190 [marine sediment metagenome]|uniref:Uncharacterized protein n=1 Tax=marine sediment metagenome TaxID=412755 RepID=A0A0F9LEF0_9ZZZZ